LIKGQSTVVKSPTFKISCVFVIFVGFVGFVFLVVKPA